MAPPLRLFIDDLWLSPYTYSVYTALLEKKMGFTLETVSFEQGKSRSAVFRDRAPTDLIPLLEEGSFVLAESLAILEYLEERYPSPDFPAILPRDAHERAHARMLLSWYRCGMKALRDERSSETVFYPELRAKQPLSADAQEEVRELMEFLSQTGAVQRGTLFAEWSIADAETALMLQRLIKNGDPIAPEWREYADRQWARASVRPFVEQSRKPFRSYYR